MEVNKRVMKVGTSLGIIFNKDDVGDLGVSDGMFVNADINVVKPQIVVKTRDGRELLCYGIRVKLDNHPMLWVDCPEQDKSCGLEFANIKSVERVKEEPTS